MFTVMRLGNNEGGLTFGTIINTSPSLITSLMIPGTNFNDTTNKTATLTYSTAANHGTSNLTLTATDDHGFTFNIQNFNVIVDQFATVGTLTPASLTENSNTNLVTLNGIMGGFRGENGGTEDAIGTVSVSIPVGSPFFSAASVLSTSLSGNGTTGSAVLSLTVQPNVSSALFPLGPYSTINVTVTDPNDPNLTQTYSISIPIGQIDLAPTVTATTNGSPTTGVSANQGSTYTFNSSTTLIMVADPDALNQSNTTVEKLTLQVTNGTLNFASIADFGTMNTNKVPYKTGNGTSTIVIQDTIDNLNQDLMSGFIYTNNNVLGDQLVITMDDLGNVQPVVDPANPTANSLTFKKTIPITINSVANVTVGTVTTTVDSNVVNANDYLAHHPLTYLFPITNSSGPSGATNLVFTATFSLDSLINTSTNLVDYTGNGQSGFTALAFGSVTVTDASGLNLPFVTTSSNNQTGTIVVKVPSLPINATAKIYFSVTTMVQGTLSYSDSVSFSELPMMATGTTTATKMPSVATPLTVQDAGLVSFQPVANSTDADFDAKVGIPRTGGEIDLPGGIIDMPTYTDYPVPVVRTKSLDPSLTAGQTIGAANHDDLMVTINLSGRADFGPMADYAIVVGSNLYTTTSSAKPIVVLIPDGQNATSTTSAGGQVYIRVYKSFSIVPKPDVNAVLTLAPPPNDPLMGQEVLASPPQPEHPQTASITLKHPQLIVNDNSDASIFDPTTSHFTLRGVIDALNAYAMTGVTIPAEDLPIRISFLFTSTGQGSTITLATPLEIRVPVDLVGTVSGSNLPTVTIVSATGFPNPLPPITNPPPSTFTEGLIFGPAAAGSLIGSSGSILQSLILSGFNDGILLEDTKITIQGSTFQDNQVGVQVDSSGNIIGYSPTIGTSTINAVNQFFGNQIGVRIGETGGQVMNQAIDASGNTVADNIINVTNVKIDKIPIPGIPLVSGLAANYGVQIVDAANNTIGGLTSSFLNFISGNALAGILIQSTNPGVTVANGNVVEGNSIGPDATGLMSFGTQNMGVDLMGLIGSTKSGTTVSDNMILGNSQYGIDLVGSSYLSLSGNMISGDGQYGINLAGSSNLSLSGNTISGNSQYGINLAGSSSLSISGNSILGDGQYGINLAGSSNLSISGNTISGNSRYGIDLGSSSNVTIAANLIGTNAAGNAAMPNGTEDEIDPITMMPVEHAGLYIFGANSNNNTIIGNTISGNSGSGVLIEGAGATGETIQGNFIGTDSLGGISLGGQTYGIHLVGLAALTNNLPSGNVVSNNVISGNTRYGVYLDGSSGVLVTANRIGTNAAGTTGVPNGTGAETSIDPVTMKRFEHAGVFISGANSGGDTISNNVISGNSGSGVLIEGAGATGETIYGNFIGTDVNGNTLSHGVQTYGVHLVDVTGGMIGGTGAGNVISGNTSDGVYLDGSSGFVVTANMIGTNAAGSGGVPNGNGAEASIDPVTLKLFEHAGVFIDGAGSGNNTISNNLISGNSGFVNPDKSVNPTSGILIEGSGATGETIQGNFIGTDSLGGSSLKVQTYGIHLVDLAAMTNNLPSNNVVSNNLVSGNTRYGVYLDGSSGVLVTANRIGTNQAGSGAVGNGVAGVFLDGSAISGATTPSHKATTGNSITGNVISGNASSGLLILGAGASAEVVQRNFIGTDLLGGQSLGGQTYGIQLINVSSGTIGATATGPGNVISGNGQYGVYLDGSSGVTVSGNLIGISADAKLAVANGNAGVFLDGMVDSSTNPPTAKVTDNNTITGNMISGNTGSGVLIQVGSFITPTGVTLTGDASSNSVQFNDIGTTTDLRTSVGNVGDGIKIVGTAGVMGTSAVSISNLTISNNVIDSNLGNGINAQVVTDLSVSLNALVGNLQSGLQITDASQSSTRSGVVGNFVTANGQNGIDVAGSVNDLTLTSNTIGSTVSSTNKKDGVLITASPSTSGDGTSVTLTGNNSAGNGQDGLQLDGALGVRISSGNVFNSNLSNGVELSDGASGNTLTGGTISSNAVNGILIATGSNNNSVNSATIDSNLGNGVDVVNSINNSVSYATILANQGNGVDISGSRAVSAKDSNIEDNTGDGVRIEANSSANVVSGDSLLDNVGNGVSIVDSGQAVVNNLMFLGNQVQGNVIVGSHNSGIQISGLLSTMNVLSQNIISAGNSSVLDSNQNDGISILKAGTGNLVDRSTILDSLNDGLSISATSGTVVQNNLIGALGTNLGNHNFGLSIDNNSDFSVVTGNQILNNQSDGVVISGQSLATMVMSNTIGFNKLAGILLLNTSYNSVGQNATGNIIVANATDGVQIFQSSNNVVQGNFIGTDSSAMTTGLGNLGDGVHIVGSSSSTSNPGLILDSQMNQISDNTISANKQSGIEIFGNSTQNLVLDNTLGTRSTQQLLENKLDGVLISGSTASVPSAETTGSSSSTNPTYNTISGNTIAGNLSNGVAVNLASTNDLIGNTIGTIPSVMGSLGNSLDGVSVSASTDTVIENLNNINGNLGNGITLVSSSGTMIRGGNSITSNTADGISLIQSNANATVLDPSLDNSILDNNISGNSVDGIGLNNSSFTTLSGNNILANAADGIRVEESSTNNSIGIAGGVANVIGQQVNGAGIEIRTGSTGNSVQNNMIGYDDSGISMANPIGIYLNNVSLNTIGGAEANTITGNKSEGVLIQGNGSSTLGNVVQNNLIGTDENGETPKVFSLGTSDVGVFVLNSQSNIIQGNVVSGNHLAGIELFGTLSVHNSIVNNTVGSDVLKMSPIVFDRATTPNTVNQVPVTANGSYPNTIPTTLAAEVRQYYGIWINGAGTPTGSPSNPANTVSNNNILANQVGIEVDGTTAANNLIVSNFIGYHPLNPIEGSTNVDGLGNFYGIYLNNSPSNDIGEPGLGNLIEQNVSVGVEIFGQAASNNTVKNNLISSNGGYVVPFQNGSQSPIYLVDFVNAYKATLANPQAASVYGSGVYIESGQNNIVSGNTIKNNTEVGVYIYNFGTNPAIQGNSITNTISGNTIAGVNQTDGPYSYVNGEYGVLLFNSSGNYYGVIQNGAGKNKVSNDLIADFREYTGPGASNSNKALTAVFQTSSALNINAAASKSSVSPAVKVKTGGKGHPPPTGHQEVRHQALSGILTEAQPPMIGGAAFLRDLPK